MNAVTLSRHKHGSYHDPEDALLGLLIKSRLAKMVFSKASALELLAASFSLPGGAPFYMALRRGTMKQLWSQNQYISLNNAAPNQPDGEATLREIDIPNFILDARVRKQSLHQFLHASEEELAGAVYQAMQGSLSWPLSWRRLCDYFESTLAGSGFSPALIAHVNFVSTFASGEISWR